MILELLLLIAMGTSVIRLWRMFVAFMVRKDWTLVLPFF